MATTSLEAYNKLKNDFFTYKSNIHSYIYIYNV